MWIEAVSTRACTAPPQSHLSSGSAGPSPWLLAPAAAARDVPTDLSAWCRHYSPGAVARDRERTVMLSVRLYGSGVYLREVLAFRHGRVVAR